MRPQRPVSAAGRVSRPGVLDEQAFLAASVLVRLGSLRFCGVACARTLRRTVAYYEVAGAAADSLAACAIIGIRAKGGKQSCCEQVT